MNTLLLVDAFAIIYRAYFAFQKYPRYNSQGLSTGTIYGFINSLLEALRTEQPTHCIVAFDTPVLTFRHKRYPNYKAQREKQPEEITASLPWIHKLLSALRISTCMCDGYEADDLIGTLAKSAHKELQVLMMTPDKDFAQLIDQNIWLYRPSFMKKPSQKIGLEELSTYYGVAKPSQIIDLLALKGDAIDNIPGVPGIGPKTAFSLIEKYESVENVLEHRADLPKKLHEKLKTYHTQALESKSLATICTSAPVTWQADRCLVQTPNKSALRPLLSQLEFKTLAARLLGDVGPLFSTNEENRGPIALPSDKMPPLLASSVTPQYHILSVSDMEHVVPFLLKQQAVAFQLDYTYQRPQPATLHAISFAYTPYEAYVIDISQNSEEAQKTLSSLVPCFESSTIQKIGHQVKESLLVLRHYGISMAAPFFDTTIAHYVLHSEANHNLEALAEQYLEVEHTIEFSKSKPLALAEQALQVYLLHKKLSEKLKQEKLMSLFEKVDTPLVEVLADMEATGVFVQEQALHHLSTVYTKEMQKLEDKIYAEAGRKFNISSPKQLGEVLFDELKLSKNPVKTKTGSYATSEEVLIQLQQNHPIISQVLSFREYQKLCSTYIEGLLKFIHPADGRIHTQYRQAVAATGRLSSNYPNLQNIPIRTAKGRVIRQVFTAHKGYYLVSADYSQIELRIMASFAGDQPMLEALARKEDIHQTTASQIFNTPLASVDANMRRQAKSINFGIIYGISAFGLAQQLQIGRKEAKEIIEAYFQKFPAIVNYLEQTLAFARSHQYVETYWKRRRYLPNINSRNATTRAFTERTAINAPIQGTAADIIKVAMVRVAYWLREQKLRTKLILQIHDELLFEAPEDELSILHKHLPILMTQVIHLATPLEVSIGTGSNWLEAH